MTRTALLTGTVKNYDWGGFFFIPSLLKTENDGKKPFAEYWLGVHPQADCRVEYPGNSQLLRDIIRDKGSIILGEYVFRHFGNMPFLLKALDVRDMLSIQVHPSKKQAEIEFALENRNGVPLDAPTRNYKDDNHKPELMVAMGEFWLLHGFKPSGKMKEVLGAVPELATLLPVFVQGGYKQLYKTVMEMPQEEVNRQLQPLLDRIIPLYKQNKLGKSGADYWAAKAALTFSQPGKTDRGIYSVYLFNLVRLERGEAIFQDAGVPHAYLEGQNVEIMASSDNVLRGGLTTKHIDVKELLKHTRCEETVPVIVKGTSSGSEKVYRTPAPDFELSSFTLASGDRASFTPSTAEILLLVEGEMEVGNDSDKIVLKKGSPSAVVFPGKQIHLLANQPSWVFRATVPEGEF